MRKVLIVVFLLHMLGCGEEGLQILNQMTDGYYQGYFDFQGQSYYSLIQFENGRYEEWPSGGAMYQKSMGCLSVGFYSTKNGFFTFELDSYKHQGFPESCITEMVLPGVYDIIYSDKQDSLVFKRGSGKHEITYYLKKGE